MAHILIVDDQPLLLRMMSVYLSRLGYSVTTETTTERAWEHVEKDPDGTDVAVLDGTMAGIGLEDLALRMLRANPHLRILGASGYPVDMTAVEAAAPGRVAFLQKPFTPEMLAKAVRSLLGAEEKDV
ncbi:MAG TPA: response regulator [Verrucomicrobiae bacterium]|nr:response regulator [Verrucomicrobiae bacterium]